MRAYVLCALFVFAACAESPAPAPAVAIDPSGTWDLVIAWGDGTCGETGTMADAFVVAAAGDTGYAITNTATWPTSAALGCDDASCAMLATEHVFQVVAADYALELASGEISGHVRVTVPYVSDDPRDPRPCWQVGTVTGAVDL